MKRLIVCTFIICIFLGPKLPLSGQDKEIYELPPWLILEYGKKAFEEREYGVALRYAREAIEKTAHFYPEAEILIGDVFEAEGNIELAIEQYEKALNNDNAKQLYIQDEKYEVYYKLAEIYYQKYQQESGTGNKERYRGILEKILEDDNEYNETMESNLKTALVRTLKQSGLDRLVILYRLNSHFSLEAHSRLGKLNLDDGEYDQAALHFIFVVLSIISKAIEELKFHDPEYEFERSEAFFEACTRYELIQNYFENSNLFNNMVSLGDAILGSNDEANEEYAEVTSRIWELARSYSPDERIRFLVDRKLASPPFR